MLINKSPKEGNYAAVIVSTASFLPDTEAHCYPEPPRELFAPFPCAFFHSAHPCAFYGVNARYVSLHVSGAV